MSNPIWDAISGSLESQIASFNGSLLGTIESFVGLTAGRIAGIVVNLETPEAEADMTAW